MARRQPLPNPGTRRAGIVIRRSHAQRNSPAETKNNFGWKIYKTTRPAPTKIRECNSCDCCEQMIHGLSDDVFIIENDLEMKFIYKEDLTTSKSIVAEFNEHNLKIVHEIHTALQADEDFFKNFDVLFGKYFKNDQPKRNILQLQLFEKLYLRAIAYLTRYKFLTPLQDVKKFKLVPHVKFELSFHLGIASASTSGQGNLDDLPTEVDFIVESAYSEFDNFVRLAYIYFNCEMLILQKHLLLKYLVGKIRSMFELTKNSPDFIKNRRNLAYNFLKNLQVKLQNDFSIIESQRIQVFELCGKSGAGKSTAVQHLSQIVLAMLKYIPKRDIIYTRANDYWWNGYCGQPIILYDDLTHIKKKLKFDLAFELIAVASGTFRNPPMAFDKDMQFTSSLVMLTSNIPVITTVAEQSTVTALKRRIISQNWGPLEGMASLNNDIYEYHCSGLILNSIWSERSIFSVFSEVLQIIKESKDFNITFDGGVDDISFDEETLQDSPSKYLEHETLQVACALYDVFQSSGFKISENPTCSKIPISTSSVSKSSRDFLESNSDIDSGGIVDPIPDSKPIDSAQKASTSWLGLW